MTIYQKFFSRQNSRTAVLLAMTFALLSGCSTDMGDLEKWVADKKAARVPFRDDLPVVKPYEPYRYSAKDLRSPFRPNESAVVKNPNASGVQPVANRNKQPLENYPLDSLRMVGSLERQNTKFGLVQAPDGLIHRVQTGNYVGENDGQINAVSDSSIDLIEIVPDGLGGYIERDASIGLSD